MKKNTLTKHPAVLISIATVCLASGILVSRHAPENSNWIWLGAFLSTVSGLTFLLGMFGFMNKERHIDERFILHRLKATRFALILGMIAMAGWLLYEMLAHDVLRWDYLVIIGVIAAAKLGAMLFYRSTE